MKLWFNKVRHRRERKLQERDKATKAAQLKEAMEAYKPVTNKPGAVVTIPPTGIPFLEPDAPTDYHWKPASADNEEYGNFVQEDSASTDSSSNDGSSGGCE